MIIIFLIRGKHTRIIDIRYRETATIEFINEKTKGRIKVVKLSANDNKYTSILAKYPLKDVVFQVLDDNNNVIDTITIDENEYVVEIVKHKDEV